MAQINVSALVSHQGRQDKSSYLPAINTKAIRRPVRAQAVLYLNEGLDGSQRPAEARVVFAGGPQRAS